MTPAVVFAPNWWHKDYGISFEQPFYLDQETRIRNDVLMRKAAQNARRADTYAFDLGGEQLLASAGYRFRQVLPRRVRTGHRYA